MKRFMEEKTKKIWSIVSIICIVVFIFSSLHIWNSTYRPHYNYVELIATCDDFVPTEHQIIRIELTLYLQTEGTSFTPGTKIYPYEMQYFIAGPDILNISSLHFLFTLEDSNSVYVTNIVVNNETQGLVSLDYDDDNCFSAMNNGTKQLRIGWVDIYLVGDENSYRAVDSSLSSNNIFIENAREYSEYISSRWDITYKWCAIIGTLLVLISFLSSKIAPKKEKGSEELLLSHHHEIKSNLENIKENKLGDLVTINKNNLPKFSKDISIIAKKLDEDPDYCYAVSIKNGKTSIGLTPKHKDATPIKGHITIKQKVVDGKPVDLMEELDEAHKTGQPIIKKGEEVIDFDVKVPGKVLMEDLPKNNNFMLVFTPEPLVAPDAFRIVIPETDNYFDKIMLGQTYRSDEKFILDSEKRNLPYNFIFHVFEERAKFTFSFDKSIVELNHAIKFEKFLSAINEKKYMQVIRERDEKILMEGNINPDELAEWNEEWLKILLALDFIQEKTDTKFHLPESVVREEIMTIFEVEEIIKTGQIEQTFSDFSIEIKRVALAEFLKNLKDNDILEKCDLRYGVCNVTILDKEIELGPVHYMLPPLKLRDDKSELLKNAEDSSEEFINLKFEPAKENKFKMIYEKWKSDR